MFAMFINDYQILVEREVDDLDDDEFSVEAEIIEITDDEEEDGTSEENHEEDEGQKDEKTVGKKKKK
jgi:hypothetical protein